MVVLQSWLVDIVLLPSFFIPVLIIRKAIDYSRGGGAKRSVGIMVSVILGLLCIYGGWMLAFEGYVEVTQTGSVWVTYPIAGWSGIVLGGVYTVAGSIWSVLGRSKPPDYDDE